MNAGDVLAMTGQTLNRMPCSASGGDRHAAAAPLPWAADSAFGLLRRFLARRPWAGSKTLIDSAKASVAACPTAGAGAGAAAEAAAVPGSAAPAIVLPVGAVFALPTGCRITVLSGRLWLTHAGDARDFFPRAGDVLVGGEHTVVEAWSAAAVRCG